MSESIRRIYLPSGGWWEITTRPLWRHTRTWFTALHGPDSDRDLVLVALASLTTAWSFREDISAETVAGRKAIDLVAILEVFQRDVASQLTSAIPAGLSETLFAGLLNDSIPAEFAEVALMAATGWSWHTLETTPADVVQRMAVYLAVRQAREAGGSLDFTDGVEEDNARPTRP